MLNLFFHTRCKQTKFCNKHCKKEAHTKEKSTKKEPENLSNREDFLKMEIEAEMKRQEKRERRRIKDVKMFTSSCFTLNRKTDLKKLENLNE